MKKSAVLCMLPALLFCIRDAGARPVSREEAGQFARNWALEKWGRTAGLNPGQVTAAGQQHVVNFPEGGWMLIAADDAAWPVIAFSPTGSYSGAHRPPQLVWWTDKVNQVIASAAAAQQQALPEAEQAWQRFRVSAGDFAPQRQTAEAAEGNVGPLLTTAWDQGIYYNSSCPEDAAGPDGHAMAGCVATAMAQVMKYYNYPAMGAGSHAYVHSTYGTLSANFGAAAYSWAAMPNSLSDYNQAVATLIYHAGVSVDMEYSPDGSGAEYEAAAYALKTYFRYSSSLRYLWKADYSADAWTALLRTELNSRRPVLYGGSGSDGHAFVCDGYSGSNYFHFNWGFGGDYDGYFYLNALTPGDDNFTFDQDALVGIQPALPDLTADSPSVDNSSPSAGRGFRVSATVRNVGGGASPATLLRFHLSTDSFISPGDAIIGSAAVGALSAGAASSLAVQATAPAAGTYYVGACAAAVSGELNTGNNCSSGVKITVKNGGGGLLMMLTPVLARRPR